LATKYIEKFESVSALEAAAPANGGSLGIGAVSNVLYAYDGTNFVPLTKTPIVTLTAGATLDPETHSNRTVLFNSADGGAIVLPAATGGGDKYRIRIQTALTTDLTVTAPSGTILKGAALINDTGGSTAATSDMFAAGASDEVFTFIAATGGGKVGDYVEFEDIASGVYGVFAVLSGVVDPATPFTSA
jgi:hypothetical protein